MYPESMFKVEISKTSQFSSENYQFYSGENCRILYGRVFVMYGIQGLLPLAVLVNEMKRHYC